MKSGIYIIICMPTMKSYIGSAVNIKSRLGTHRNLLRNKKHWISYFQNSWNKYGEADFEFHVIEYCQKEKLIEREQFYLDIFKAVRHGFNLNKKAASTLGYKQTKNACENVARARKRLFKNPIFREKYNKMMKSAEWRESHAKAMATSEHKELLSRKGRERYSNPTERDKQSEAIKISWQNPEIRQKRIFGLNKPDVLARSSERMRQYMSNPENRKHLSTMATKQFADPEARKRMSLLKKEQYSNPESRLKQSARNVKFSKEEARKIKVLLVLGVTPDSLCEMFGCGVSTISNIKNKKILAYGE